MTFEFPLWLGPAAGQSEGPPFGAQQYRQLVDLLFAEGVLNVAAGQLLVTATTGLTLNIAPGAYVVDGDDVTGQGSFYGRNLAPGATVTLAAAPGTGSRIDLIVVKVNDSESTGQTTNNAGPLVVTGTSTTGTPAVPPLPGSAIPLAQVLVAAGTSTITSGMVTDLRTQSGSTGYGPAAPAMTTAQRDLIPTPGTGLQVFNTTTGKLEVYGGSTLGWVSGARIDVQTFTASGTWTKPSGASLVFVDVIGAGGGGGGGGGGNTYGAPGAGGGARRRSTIAAALLTATVSVVVGAAGVGGIASNPGTAGGNSSFAGAAANGGSGGPAGGAQTTAGGPGGGVGGATTSFNPAYGGAGGIASGSAEDGGAGGGSFTSSGGIAGGSSVSGGGGGGAGGGATGGGVLTAGAPGGGSGATTATAGTLGAGAAGTTQGVAGTPGQSGSPGTVSPATSTGGGGGGGAPGGSGNNTPGGTGGAGASPGGGGGGGGGGNGSTGSNGGVGGNGGRGEVRVYTICV